MVKNLIKKTKTTQSNILHDIKQKEQELSLKQFRALRGKIDFSDEYDYKAMRCHNDTC